jgi:C4-dicarboxylate-specific signal transduction histidine kinase
MGRARELLKLLEKKQPRIKPKLNQRIDDLESIEKNSDSMPNLVSAREDVITLLKDYPNNSRLNSLLKRINKRLRGMK